jgi:hypothetical protein
MSVDEWAFYMHCAGRQHECQCPCLTYAKLTKVQRMFWLLVVPGYEHSHVCIHTS